MSDTRTGSENTETETTTDVEETTTTEETTEITDTQEGASEPNPGSKEAARRAYERRQEQARLKVLETELEGYKRREEEARKAKLTDEQRREEELLELRAENDRLKVEGMRKSIAAEFKLPPVLASRLIGSDEAAMRADAEELARLVPKPKVGATTNPVKETPATATAYTREQLRKDPKLAADVNARLRKGELINIT